MKVLLVDDDRAVREALSQTVELAGLTPVPAGSLSRRRTIFRLIFKGLSSPISACRGRDGFHLLDHVRSIDIDLPVILLTGEGDVPSAVRGITGGGV